MKQIEHLLSALETVRQHGDAETVEWFDCGCLEYLTGSEKKSLDICLGLLGSSKGTPTQRTQFMKQLRNQYLKDAFDSIDPDQADIKRCELLAQAIRDFESRIYIHWKRAGGPPEHSSELRRKLYAAKETGQPLSTHWRSLVRIIFGY